MAKRNTVPTITIELSRLEALCGKPAPAPVGALVGAEAEAAKRDFRVVYERAVQAEKDAKRWGGLS